MAGNVVEIILSVIKKGSGDKEMQSSLGKLTGALKTFAASAIAIKVATEAFDQLKKAVNETVEYNKTVREMTQVTGLGADEISRIIQVGDDWGISIEELRTALDFMNKSGVSPSIENLATLADEYVNTKDKTAFAEKAVKLFGRGYTKLIPILAKGGDALREQTDAVSDSLIATQESIDASREYEVAMDDFNDTVQGLKLQLGNGLLPVLVDILEITNKLTGEMSEEETAHRKLKNAVDKGIITSAEYNKAMWSLRIGTEHYKDIVEGIEPKIDAMALAIAGANASLVPYSDYVGKAQDYTGKWKTSVDELRGAAENAEGPILRLATASDIYKTSVEKLTKEGFDILNPSMAESLRLEALIELWNGGSLVEYQKKITEIGLLKNFEALNEALEKGIVDWPTYFAMISDGIVTAEEIATATKTTGDNADYAGGRMKYMVDMIGELDGKTANVTINTFENTYTNHYIGGGKYGARQHGGPVGGGLPYLVGEAGPEMFVPGRNGMIIPNNQLTNNYNLTINEAGRRGNVVRDFNILKSLAGA